MTVHHPLPGSEEYQDAERIALGVVRKWLRGKHLPPSLGYEDFEQAARIGCWKAALKYDPATTKARFSTFAAEYALGAAREQFMVRNMVALPRRRFWDYATGRKEVPEYHQDPLGFKGADFCLEEVEDPHSWDAVDARLLAEAVLLVADPDDARILRLVFYEELTFEQIAVRLGGSNRQPAYARYQRVLRRVRKRVGVEQ